VALGNPKAAYQGWIDGKSPSRTYNFNPAVLIEDSPMGQWIRGAKEMIAEEIQQGITDKTREGYQLWGNITGQNEGVEIEIALVSAADVTEPMTRARRRYSRNLQNIPASHWIANFRWGQGPGYNENAPLINGRRALAGCPAVAIGLIANHWMFPTRFNYFAMPQVVTARTPNAVSIMFRDIADHIPGYIWGIHASGATPANITTGLHNLGFRGARMRPYNFIIAYSEIRHRRPILLAGYEVDRWGNLHSGHIWNADGYWEIVWQVTQRFLGITINRWYEFECTLFMNWGWDGQHNGWVNEASWPRLRHNRLMWYNIYPSSWWW